MEERLPLLNHTPTRSVRRRNTLVAALALALIALSLLAADARSGFAYSTSLRGSIVSFPNGDLKTITVRFHSKFMVHFRRGLPLQSLHPHAGHDSTRVDGQFHCSFNETGRLIFVHTICIVLLFSCNRLHLLPSPPLYVVLHAGLFHVEECGDDINNCEEQVGG